MLTQDITTHRRMTPAEFSKALHAANVHPVIAADLQRRHDAVVRVNEDAVKRSS